MIGVTITNLGFGDFTPSFWLSRVIVSTLSLFGIFQTALIVGVLSDALVIPPEEKRILASLEKQRLEKIRRNTAASLIQWAWRVYVFDQSQQMDCYDRAINNEVTKIPPTRSPSIHTNPQFAYEAVFNDSKVGPNILSTIPTGFPLHR